MEPLKPLYTPRELALLVRMVQQGTLRVKREEALRDLRKKWRDTPVEKR